jgi:hypothetical protein
VRLTDKRDKADPVLGSREDHLRPILHGERS